MKIDKLTIHNFRKFLDLSFDLHSQFNLLVGGNGSGKTTILDALAMCLYTWIVHLNLDRGFPARTLKSSDKRLTPHSIGDRIQFQESDEVSLIAFDGIAADDHSVEWGQTYKLNFDWYVPNNFNLKMQRRYRHEGYVTCPVLAYYGVNRASLPQNSSDSINILLSKPQRWDAYSNWLNLDYLDLRRWFFRERAAGERPGYKVVRQAVLNCLPEADNLWFDVDRADLVCSIKGNAQPLSNLSDGQRMLLAMVADIAIKAVTLNPHLLPQDELREDEDYPLPLVLKRSPGVVLIDELDLHLHPSWQRRVAEDLKRTFPSIQFIATSHSPQIVGELPREEIRVLRGDRIELPPVARGADSNWILNHVMENSASESLTARQLKDEAEEALAEGDLTTANQKSKAFRYLLDGETGDLIRLESSLATLEALEGAGV